MIGVFPGKFLPPHRGHLNAIIQAATQVDKLYVVVSGNENYMREVCKENNLREMPLMMRARWLAQELSGFDHIKVYTLDETHIPSYPNGIKPWTQLLKKTIPENFDVIFGGEEEYRHTYMKEFDGVNYKVFDINRIKYPISATKIRSNPLKYWDYILGQARSHFAKRILITGTESVGKSTLTKYLAKIYHTSWAEEYGRYHSRLNFGGDENLFIEKDFYDIIKKQKEYDDEALRNANKITFFDTDSVVTHYYRDMYLGVKGGKVDIDVSKYDKVFFMGPEVKWVEDGFRFKGKQKERKNLSKELLNLYKNYGFKNIIEVHEINYHSRLNRVIDEVDSFLKGE